MPRHLDRLLQQLVRDKVKAITMVPRPPRGCCEGPQVLIQPVLRMHGEKAEELFHTMLRGPEVKDRQIQQEIIVGQTRLKKGLTAADVAVEFGYITPEGVHRRDVRRRIENPTRPPG